MSYLFVRACNAAGNDVLNLSVFGVAEQGHVTDLLRQRGPIAGLELALVAADVAKEGARAGAQECAHCTVEADMAVAQCWLEAPLMIAQAALALMRDGRGDIIVTLPEVAKTPTEIAAVAFWHAWCAAVTAAESTVTATASTTATG